MPSFSLQQFQDLLAPVAALLADHDLDETLAAELNTRFGPESDTFKAIESACHAGVEAGALCQHEAGGIRYGRAIKPCAALQGCSVDVVHMVDVKGPHHRHPKGEIDLVMPITESAAFDGHSAGWVVYAPDSAHHPTVQGGEALVLYLLPDGEIEFTRTN